MPRRARAESPTGLYHVTARAAEDRLAFVDDHDRTHFLGALSNIVAQHDWLLYAYCLMSTHYHLVLRSPMAALSRGMQRLHSRYVAGFNARHHSVGRLFGSRFHSVPIERESHLVQACLYVAENPVRAGLCVEPEDWFWSSCRASLGLAPRPGFLASLDDFGLANAMRGLRSIPEIRGDSPLRGQSPPEGPPCGDSPHLWRVLPLRGQSPA
jgi:REP element-mobilizing transposase RayT